MIWRLNSSNSDVTSPNITTINRDGAEIIDVEVNFTNTNTDITKIGSIL